jgi:predicted nucleotidyltransferase
MKTAMTREEVLETLQAHYPEMGERFGVASLAIFGSASRNELRDGSDVDVLVTLKGPATFDGYFALKYYLEELLGREVDLATDKMVKPRLRRRIANELLHVA